MPEIIAYLDVRDERGAVLPTIESSTLTAQLDGALIPVAKVQPFAEAEEGVAYIFMVDVSRSIKPVQFNRIRTALTGWIEAMGERDYAALLIFGDQVELQVDFTQDKNQLKAAVTALNAESNNTRLHDGLMRALDMGRRLDQNLPGRRVMITLTDGLDDIAGGITRDEILTRLREERLPLYAIGFASPPMNAQKREGLKSLGILARASGGAYLDAGGGNFEQLFQTLRQRVGEVQLVRMDCATCPADGGLHTLNVVLSDGSRMFSDQQNVRLLPVAQPVQPAPPPHPPTVQPADEAVAPADAADQAPAPASKPNTTAYLLAGGGGLLLVLGLLAFLLIRSRRRKQAPPEEPVQSAQPPNSWDYADFQETTESADLQPTFIEQEPPQPPGPSFMVHIATVAGRNRDRTWHAECRRELVFGRSGGCNIVVDDDPEVSSRHLRLVVDRERLFVEDLGSTNGVLLNGVPLGGAHPLTDGDIVTLGRTDLRINYERNR